MGYTTSFDGQFRLNKPLTVPDYRWLMEFKDARHEDPEFPGIWCQWMPTEDGTAIQWDEGEKFYEYVLWLKWLIENFFKLKGYVLNGDVDYEGEDQGDVGTIHVKDNFITTEEKTLAPGIIVCPHCGEKIDLSELDEDGE